MNGWSYVKYKIKNPPGGAGFYEPLAELLLCGLALIQEFFKFMNSLVEFA